MIIPTRITDFNRTDDELTEFLVFAICVAGKNSDQTAVKVDKFFSSLRGSDRTQYLRVIAPFDFTDLLRAVRMGQYTRISKAIRAAVRLDLRRCTVEELEQAIGKKSARFFIMHSRAGLHCAALDTHILRWMRDHVAGMEVGLIPEATPSSAKVYARLEKLFLAMIAAFYPALSVADADLLIWKQYSGRGE